MLADVGSVLLGIQLMRLVATRRATWMAALLLALLPVSVRYSQEVRMYTLLGFWLMAATVALVCWARTPGQKRWPCLYVLLMSAAFYTHYFAAGCVLVHWLFWWRARADHAASLSPRAWCLANAAIVLLFVPWLPNLLEQLSAGVAAWIEPVTVQAALGLPWQFMLMEPRVAPASWWRLAPLLLIVLCATLIVAQGIGERRYRPLLLGYFFIPTISLFVLALFMPLFLARYLVFAAPGIPRLSPWHWTRWHADTRARPWRCSCWWSSDNATVWRWSIARPMAWMAPRCAGLPVGWAGQPDRTRGPARR